MATELKLTAGDAAEFGKSVALSGDHAIVGARKPSMSFISPGWAYIFVKNGTSWIQQAKLSAGLREESSDYFGAAVAIDGDYAVVGAPHVGAEEGQVHVFHRNGSNWTQEGVLVPGDPIAFGHFGRSVSISADWAIVGSNQAAYLFQRTGSTWIEQAKFTGAGGDFGQAVALSGNYAVVGAFNSTEAYVYQRTGTTWQQQAVLAASDGTASNNFGWSVAVNGDYIIVGAFGATASSEAGAAYVFVRTGSMWIQQAKLEPGSVTQQGVKRFGQSVALSGNYAVVGDSSDDDVAPGSGAVYVFQRQGMSWPLVEKIVAGDASLFDGFGTSVAMDGSAVGGLVIVGTPDNGAGAAYLLSDFPVVSVGLVDPSRYAIYAKILFGLIGGGGGVVWLPGTGPVPVDPEPFKTWSSLSPTRRDVLLGLALSELANLISDGKVRQEIKAAGLTLVKQAANHLQIPGETNVH